MKRQFFSLTLALTLLLCSFPVCAQATESENSEPGINLIFVSSDEFQIPEGAIGIPLDGAENTNSPIQSRAAFNLYGSNLAVDTYKKTSTSYYLSSGDKLKYNVTWAPTGNICRIGFWPTVWAGKYYFMDLGVGGTAKGTMSTNGVPSGDYYIFVGNSGDNSAVMTSVTAVLEWT